MTSSLRLAELTAEEAGPHPRRPGQSLVGVHRDAGSHAEYMLFPRLAALAEVVWSPRASRDWKDFTGRLSAQLERYRRAGIAFRRKRVQCLPRSPARSENVDPDHDDVERARHPRDPLQDRRPESRTPPLPSPTGPLRLKRTATVRAGTFVDGLLVGKISETRFLKHKALGKAPKLAHPYKERYKGGGDIGLVDGLRGSKSHTDGHWQGFEGDDLDAVIDFGRTERISAVTVGFLQNANAWIFLPARVEFAVSRDGKDFETVATVEDDVPTEAADIVIEDFAARLNGVKARYLRVTAKTIGVCPPGHPGAGGKAWIFADEIIVD